MARVAYMACGMHGRVGAIHGKGGIHGRGHAWQGASMVGWGHAWQEGMHGRGLCVAGETAAAAGSTHPTGMHSCHLKRFPFFWGRKKT